MKQFKASICQTKKRTYPNKQTQFLKRIPNKPTDSNPAPEPQKDPNQFTVKTKLLRTKGTSNHFQQTPAAFLPCKVLVVNFFHASNLFIWQDARDLMNQSLGWNFGVENSTPDLMYISNFGGLQSHTIQFTLYLISNYLHLVDFLMVNIQVNIPYVDGMGLPTGPTVLISIQDTYFGHPRLAYSPLGSFSRCIWKIRCRRSSGMWTP